MGHVEFTLRLTNGSSGTCAVAARPSLQLIGRGGEPLPSHVSPWPPEAAASPVALRPGTTALAAALVAVDIPGPGDSHRKGGPCQPSAMELRVGTAGKTSTLVPVQPPISVCQRGSILLKSLVTREPAPKIPSGLLVLIRGLIPYPPAEYTLTVRYDPRETNVVVKDGDNRGHTVAERNVVVQLVRLGAWRGHPMIAHLPAPPQEGLKTVVIVQGDDGGKILGVLTQPKS